MKKSLLTTALAALTLTGSAQVYDEYKGMYYSTMSPNGRYVAEDINGTITTYDRYTADKHIVAQESDNYSAYANYGMGRCMSNTGILVGFDGSAACYWKNGVKTVLTGPSGDTNSMDGANAITSDGKYIVGELGTDVSFGGEGLMARPAIWTLQADGTYKCKTLPYKKTDWRGRVPQYIMANQISDDGKTIVVQVVDYNGFVIYPTIYKYDEQEEEWTYEDFGDGYLWDESKKALIPEEPADPSDSCPQAASYMTSSDSTAYNAAVDAYRDAYEQYQQGLITYDKIPAYPYMWDYITDNKAQWSADSAAYEAAVEQFYNDYDTYNTALQDAILGSFEQNSLQLSTNGRFLAALWHTRGSQDGGDGGDIDDGGFVVASRKHKALSDEAAKPETDTDTDVDFGGDTDVDFGGDTDVDYGGDTDIDFGGDDDDYTDDVLDEEGDFPILLDLTSENEDVYITYLNDGLPSSVTDEGMMMVNYPSLSYCRTAYVCEIESDPVPFYDYIAERDEKAGEFLKTNYTFNVPVEDDEDDWGVAWSTKKAPKFNKAKTAGLNFSSVANKFHTKDYTIVSDSLITGTVAVNNDGTIFSSFMVDDLTYYDTTQEEVYRSYVIDLNPDAQSAVKNVSTNKGATSPVLRREFYSVSGQRLNTLPTNGVYLEKNYTANGVSTAKRVK